jgi:hypothetical protein
LKRTTFLQKIHDLEKRIDELVKGKAMEMVTRKLRNDGSERGVIVYGYKLRPVMQG